MSALTVTKTTKTIGAEITGIGPDDLLKDESIMASSWKRSKPMAFWYSVTSILIPRRRWRSASELESWTIQRATIRYVVSTGSTRDTTKNSAAEYLKGTFHWHIDGCTPLHDEPPQKATRAERQSRGELRRRN